jgi:hypothetical protein
MNDIELMSRLRRLADHHDPDPAGDNGFWEAMVTNVTAEQRRAALVNERRRRRGWWGGSGAALLAMAAAALLYVRVQHHRAMPAPLDDQDDESAVFQDQDVGELTDGLDQTQLQRVADALKKGA